MGYFILEDRPVEGCADTWLLGVEFQQLGYERMCTHSFFFGFFPPPPLAICQTKSFALGPTRRPIEALRKQTLPRSHPPIPVLPGRMMLNDIMTTARV